MPLPVSADTYNRQKKNPFTHTAHFYSGEFSGTMIQWHSQNSGLFLLLWLGYYLSPKRVRWQHEQQRRWRRCAQRVQNVCRQLFIYLSNYFMCVCVCRTKYKHKLIQCRRWHATASRACVGAKRERKWQRHSHECINVLSLMLLYESDSQKRA